MSEYPLEQVLGVKIKRVEQAEQELKDRRKELEAEEKKLKEVEAERDKTLKHKEDKLQQLRDALDEGTTAPEVKQMKQYLDIVKEQLVEKEKKVDEQKEKVVAAEKAVQEAEELLRKRRIDVDKIEIHKKEWQKQADKELRRKEEKVEDELGSVMFTTKQREGKKKR